MASDRLHHSVRARLLQVPLAMVVTSSLAAAAALARTSTEREHWRRTLALALPSSLGCPDSARRASERARSAWRRTGAAGRTELLTLPGTRGKASQQACRCSSWRVFQIESDSALGSAGQECGSAIRAWQAWRARVTCVFAATTACPGRGSAAPACIPVSPFLCRRS